MKIVSITDVTCQFLDLFFCSFLKMIQTDSLQAYFSDGEAYFNQFYVIHTSPFKLWSSLCYPICGAFLILVASFGDEEQ